MADPTNKSYDGIISWAKASDNDIKAKQLATARNITITNNSGTSVVTTAGSFDGTGTATIKLKDPVAINITGNVTGNCSGSSGSCTGNSATASAVKASRTTYSGNRPLALAYIDGITTTTDVTKSVLYSNNFYANPNTGVLTATGGFNGNATSATTATKGDTIQVTGVDSISAYPISLTNNSVVYSGNYYALQRAVNTSAGGSGLTCIPGAAVAANTEGTTTLVVGNSLAKASAENRTGNIRLYGNNAGYTTIKPSYNSTGNITLILPSSGGTLALSEVPIGTILPYLGTDSTLPENFQKCSGQTLTKASYPELFEVLYSTRIISDSSATSFTVPDLRRKYLKGSIRNDREGHIGNTLLEKLPNITGNFASFDRNEFTASHTGPFTIYNRWSSRVSGGHDDVWGTQINFDASRANSIYGRTTEGGDGDNRVIPYSYVVNWIIRVK